MDRQRTKLTVIDDSENAAGGTSIDVLYAHYPDELSNDADEPEIPEEFHIALVHGTIAKLFGDGHHEAEYMKQVRAARSSSKNSSFMSLKQYDY